MSEDKNFNRVVNLMEKSEMDSRAQEHLRVFLFSLMEDSKFEQLLNILENDNVVADNFFLCFELKSRFFDQGGGREEWDYILSKEKSLIESLG
jgi:hypothetical protein